VVEVTPELLARRARREARREEQRAANVVRAAKMHQARLAYERAASCAPSTARRSDAALDPRVTGPQIHVGCSGWYYWHWRGAFYPSELPGSQWFSRYADAFDTVELNAPFYSWPTIATVKTWLRQLGARRRPFKYAVKVSELITHRKRFVGTRTLVRDFGHIADLMGGRLGCFLFQMPPSFHYTPAALRRILSQLEPHRPNVVEFRHRSWWNQTVYRAFRDAGVTFCSCSGPRLPDELVRTTDDVYVRFHGTKQWYRHNYTKAELAVWVERIRGSGAKRVWAYFNNDRNGYAIKNARELRRQLGRSVRTLL
jgi:uncharacterized protein YecE (DUF72 family)